MALQGSSPILQGSPNVVQWSNGPTQSSNVATLNQSGSTVVPWYTSQQPTANKTDPNPNTNTSTNTTGGGTAYNPAAVAKAAQDAKNLGYINDQVSGAQAGEMNSGSVAGSTYNTQGLNLADQLRQGQTGINQARQGIAMSQINSIKSLVDTIKQGLSGSAVTLGNSNALDSSAANAVGRIYTNYGNEQRNVINNDAAVKGQEQDVAQTNLGTQKDEGIRNLSTYRDTVLDQISNDTQQKLASIDGIAQLQGLSGKVDINGIKQQVIQNAQDKIAAADSYIQSLIGGITPTSADDTAKNAYALANSGVQSSGPGLTYQQSDINPTQQLGGAPTTQLPLYLKPKTS